MTHTKSVRYIGKNDYAAIVDSIEVGFSDTAFGAEIICNDFVTAQIELASRFSTDDSDTTALLELESASGVSYFDKLDAAADNFQPTITVVTERGLIFVVIDDGKTENTHRVMDAEEVASIIRKRGISAGNIYSENISDGFMRRVRTLISTADAASRPYILINTTTEAAFAAACMKRRKQAFHAA